MWVVSGIHMCVYLCVLLCTSIVVALCIYVHVHMYQHTQTCASYSMFSLPPHPPPTPWSMVAQHSLSATHAMHHREVLVLVAEIPVVAAIDWYHPMLQVAGDCVLCGLFEGGLVLVM